MRGLARATTLHVLQSNEKKNHDFFFSSAFVAATAAALNAVLFLLIPFSLVISSFLQRRRLKRWTDIHIHRYTSLYNIYIQRKRENILSNE